MYIQLSLFQNDVKARKVLKRKDDHSIWFINYEDVNQCVWLFNDHKLVDVYHKHLIKKIFDIL